MSPIEKLVGKKLAPAYPVPTIACPNCLAPQDMLAGIDGESKPKPADPKHKVYSICASCGELTIVQPDFSRRSATADDVAEIAVFAPEKWAVICKVLPTCRNAPARFRRHRVIDRPGTAWDEITGEQA